MKIIPICPESFASNTYALISSGHALIVDPSISVDAIKKTTENENAVIEGILLTHGHFDHVLSMDELRRSENVKVYIHEKDSELLSDGRKNAFYDLFKRERAFGEADAPGKTQLRCHCSRMRTGIRPESLTRLTMRLTVSLAPRPLFVVPV